MRCIECGSAVVTEPSERTTHWYQRFSCRQCAKQFDRPSLTLLNRVQHPSDAVASRGRRHKPLTERARLLLLLLAHWLPDRRVIAVADSSYAAIELLAAVRRHVSVITRLRLDARLFDPQPPRWPGTKGRPRVSGARQPTLLQRLADPRTAW